MFNSPSRRIYLGRLPATFEKKDVEKHLASYGTIVECKVMEGFGFVEFLNLKDAQDVVETFSRQSFLGEHIVMEFAKPPRHSEVAPSQSPPSPEPARPVSSAPSGVRAPPAHAQLRYCVWVFNLSQWTRWQDLKDFGRTGGVTVAYSDIDSVDPTLGFIEYLSSEDAKTAARKLDKTELRGNIVRVRTQQQVNRDRAAKKSRSHSPVRRGEYSKDLTLKARDGHACSGWESQGWDQRRWEHDRSSAWWMRDTRYN